MTRALAGVRYDTYYEGDGVTPASAAEETNFVANYGSLHEARADHYNSEELHAQRLFANGYRLFVSYAHSWARTNAALDYLPTPLPLGP